MNCKEECRCWMFFVQLALLPTIAVRGAVDKVFVAACRPYE